MQDLTVTLIQTALEWQNPGANRARFDGLIADIGEPTDLIVLPETFSTGFTMDAESQAETMDGQTIAWMKLVAQDFNATLCGSLIVAENGHHYNRLVWATPDGQVSNYDKRHLFRPGGERDNFTPGRDRQIFRIQDWRICPLICYDLRFPVYSRGVDEYDLLLYVANWPRSRRSAWRTLLPARAVENLCYCMGVNRIGMDGNDIVTAGDSMIVDYLGKHLVDCDDTEQVVTTTLDGQALQRYRNKFPAYLDADRFHLDL